MPTQCTCLERIGDNGPCPTHGDPYGDIRRQLAPRVIKLMTIDEKIIIEAAQHAGVKRVVIRPDLSKED